MKGLAVLMLSVLFWFCAGRSPRISTPILRFCAGQSPRISTYFSPRISMHCSPRISTYCSPRISMPILRGAEPTHLHAL